MHPSKVINDPRINDTYYDPDVDKLYQYVKIGDFPPEWAAIFDSAEADKRHSEFLIKPLFRGVSKKDPQ